MKIIVALDSFKGTLTAEHACALAAAALRRSHPDAEVLECPVADGGEGTAAALVAAGRGEWREVVDVAGPLPGQKLAAAFGWLPESGTAIVEMAAASGLPLISLEQRNPMLATTRGTGELLAAALRLNPRKLLLTLGGSATVDGGTGAARALGWRFLDANGRDLPDGGAALQLIRRILPPAASVSSPVPVPLPHLSPLQSKIRNPKSKILPPPPSPSPSSSPVFQFQALCDVRNPLCGPTGAAAVFGPQKGATPAMVRELDAGLRNLADCIRRDLGIDVLDLPGGGAAGGFGAGAVAFFGARLVPGFAAVAEACGLPAKLAGADWVVTGEGCFDSQSLNGKVVGGVCGLAQAAGVKVAVLAGRLRLTTEECCCAGVARAVACAPDGLPDAEAFARAGELLTAAAAGLI